MTRRRLAGVLVGALALMASGAPPAAASADPGFPQQWGLARIGAERAWASGRGEGAVVAVVDSGVDLAHEDLRDRIVGSVSCIGSDGDPAACRGSAQDDDGHGTHVAGIAVATNDNGVGVSGVAPRASLLAVRVLAHECAADGCTARGSGADVAAGIRWAARNGADVINLSLGDTVTTAFGPDFGGAVEEAWSRGVVVVVAAGNDFALSPLANNSPAIVVAATTRNDARASYSNGSSNAIGSAGYGLAAPGGEVGDRPETCTRDPLGILSTYWDQGRSTYGCLAGTSMAAPHVAGAAAVLLGLGLSAAQTRDRLLATATDLGAPGRDSTFGSGRLDLARAVEGLHPGTPAPTVTAPPAAPAGPAAPPASVGSSSAETTPPPPTAAPPTTAGPTVGDPTRTTTTAVPTPVALPGPAAPEEGDDRLFYVGVPALVLLAGVTWAALRTARRLHGEASGRM
jgi:subtilisin family serine protease